MKKFIQILAVLSIMIMASFTAHADNFIPIQGAVGGYGSGAAFDGTTTEGISAFQFVVDSGAAVPGTIFGTPCMKLTCDGAYVTFNTLQATTFGFTVDQEAFDPNSLYSLDVYVNGVYNSSYTDFDSYESNPYSYYIFPGQNALVQVIASKRSVNGSGDYYFEPVYLTKCTLS